MNKTIIGMLHLLPLPGSPNYSGDFNEILDRAKQDLENLLEGGISTVNIENYGDVPFSKNPAKPITVSAFTKIVSNCGTPGLNVFSFSTTSRKTETASF